MADRFLICGATGGVGAALTRRLHARGAALHLVARDAGKLEALASETGATWSAGDITAEGTAARVVADAGGPLAGLAYCVGTITLKPFARLSAADFLHDYNVNALTAAMYQTMADALADAQEDKAIRVILLRGSDGNFSAGNDLEDFLKTPPKDENASVFQFLARISGATKPIVAAVPGLAIGVGVTMLLHCDLVYAADTATFSLPFAQLGLCPEAASSVPRARNQFCGDQRSIN